MRTEFAKAVAASKTTPQSDTTSAAAEAKSERYKEMLNDQVAINKDLAVKLEEMRLKVVELTSQSAKYAAESEMKDQHISLLKVDIATHRAAARDHELSDAWDKRQLWAHGRSRGSGGWSTSSQRRRN